MAKLITFKTDKSGITIRIPKTLISFVAKRHPETPVKVTDSQELMESVAEQIESEILSGDECNSDTKFHALIDEAIQESAINDRGCEFLD
jgi:hypothetical protein